VRSVTPLHLDRGRGRAALATLALLLLVLVAAHLPPPDAAAGAPVSVAAGTGVGAATGVVAAGTGVGAATGVGAEPGRTLAAPSKWAASSQPTGPTATSQPAGPASEREGGAPVVPPSPADGPAVVASPSTAVSLGAPPPAAVTVAAPQPPASDPATYCQGDGWQQRRGEAVLAALAAGPERTGFSVTFAAGREGYLGLTNLPQRRIEVFVRSCDAESDELLGHVMAHELGHGYDTTHLTAAVRAAYQAARGIAASTPWYGCSGCTDFATPAGDFAEVYAQWARGATSNLSRLGGAPGPAELEALARTFFGA